MFDKNNDHEQEKLWSPIKALPNRCKKKLENHWSTHFYEHVFTQIDEEKFAPLYHDGYSRPNKPVNELVGLEIIKHMEGLSDKQLEHKYIFDHLVCNALGKETIGDNISAKTFTNFRRRILEYEEETGRNLLQEVFDDHREYFIEEFDIDGSTQRMDTSFIEANCKHLNRIDLVAKVVHNFLTDLPEECITKLPAGLEEFAARDNDNLNPSYHLEQSEVEEKLETLVEHAAWLVDRFEDEEPYNDFQSFAHLQRVLDEQCYRIPELEAEDDTGPEEEDHGDDDDDRPGWDPVSPASSGQSKPDDAAGRNEDDDSSGDDEAVDPGEPEEREHEDDPDDQGDGGEEVAQKRVELKDGAEIETDSIQNPHDEEATFRRKNDESHVGFKVNLAETCGNDDPLRLITDVQVDTNITADTEFLENDVEELAEETGLTDLISDGAFAGEATEQKSREAGVTQHFSGIKGRQPDPEGVSLADAEFADHKLVACPQGHTPFDQEYTPETGRYWGRMDKEICANCPFEEDCFVEEKQDFYSYGFYDRGLEVARHRAKRNDPEMEEFLNLRAGAESMINEMYHNSGKQTKFTGTAPVENASVATAIGRNLKRASEHLAAESGAESAAA